MAEPIKIGDQTFIKTSDGWVDQKTKVRAPEGLTALLEKMSTDDAPQEKKKRVRIDTSRPVVKLGKTEYVWDLNGKTWIDKKTKDPVSPRFSALVEAAYNKISKSDFLYEERAPQPTKEESEAAVKKNISEAIFSNTGTVGQAAKSKAKKPAGGGTLRKGNKRINSPIVVMIEKLANIDGLLKQRLQSQVNAASSASIQSRESQIENVQGDATPVLDQETADAAAEQEDKKSNAAMMAVAVGAGALFLSQMDPVRQTFAAIIDFAKGVWDFSSAAVGYINDGLRRIVGGTESGGNGSSTNSSGATGQQGTSATPGADASAVANNQSAVPGQDSGEGESTSVFPNTGFSGEDSQEPGRGAAATAVGPEEITTPFPNNDPERSSSSRSTAATGSSTVSRPSTAGSGSPSVSPVPPSTGTPPAPPAASPASSVPPPAAASPAQPADTRNWWQRNMPTWLGGQDAPSTGGNTARDGQSSTGQQTQQATNQTAGYINPIEGRRPNSGYGWRGAIAGAHSGSHFHHGIDIAAPAGTPVRAARGGTVSLVASNWHGYGNVIAIEHDDGKRTIYCHLSRFACRQGDVVQQGQVIGYVGSTGVSTGPHLHFMVQTGNLQVPATRGSGYGTINPGSLNFTDGTTIPASMEGYGDAGSSESGLGAAASAVAGAAADLAAGALKAIAGIAEAGLGKQIPRDLSASLMRGGSDPAKSISSADAQRTGEVAAARTPDPELPPEITSPPNLAPSGSGSIENMATSSDYAGVQFYLIRMGVNQRYDAMAGMRA